MPAPVASGESESPGGPCTHWKAPPCHGARGLRTSALDSCVAEPTAGPSEMRVARFENGRDLLSTRRGPRGSGAGARASHPSRAAVFTPRHTSRRGKYVILYEKFDGVSCLTPVKPFSNDCPCQRTRKPSATAICRARRL